MPLSPLVVCITLISHNITLLHFYPFERTQNKKGTNTILFYYRRRQINYHHVFCLLAALSRPIRHRSRRRQALEGGGQVSSGRKGVGEMMEGAGRRADNMVCRKMFV